MPLDIRNASTTLENALRDTILYGLGSRLPPVASVAALRGVATRGASGSMRGADDLIAVVVGGVVVASYRWDPVSTSDDDGEAVVKPTDVAANGRWVRWTSPLRAALTPGGASCYLHELASGPLRRVLLFDRGSGTDQMLELLRGQLPAVVIDASGDDPEDATQNAGHLWLTSYEFSIHVICEHLRDRRQAAQGSGVPGETMPGANAIDGMIQSLIAGTQMFAVVDGIREVRKGRGSNTDSDLGQRLVVRSRSYKVLATEENPAAPNDTSQITEISAQPVMTDLGEHDSFSDSDYIVDGFDIPFGIGLYKPSNFGIAVIDGQQVTYIGQMWQFPPSMDTYRDLSPNGAMEFTSVAAQQGEPPLAAGALRIGMTRTDSVGVVDDTILAERRTPYGQPTITSLS